MEDELKSKISTAMSNAFVGNFIFSQDELTVLYDDIGYKLRSLATERGNVLSQVDYDELFVVLVNLAKEWDSDENAFFEYIYKKLLGTSIPTGKVYNQIILAINNLARRNKIFLLNSFTKKYYATICSHAFAPKSSTESFFDMCWEIYCNDLDQQYEENDPTFELIANALNNRFVGMAEESDNLQIGSQVYSFRAGIKGLAIDQKPLMVKLIETAIKTIDAIFNNSPIDLNLYINKLINNWWSKKETNFGIKKSTLHKIKTSVITDYSQIKPRFILDDGVPKLYIPPIRLQDNIMFEPKISIWEGEDCVNSEMMEIKGSGIIMTTKPYYVILTDLPSIQELRITIYHCDKLIYDSKNNLNRDFILFKDEKEVYNNECVPGQYILYVEDFSKLYKRPKEIYKSMRNIFNIDAVTGDIIQSEHKILFFVDQSIKRDLYFFAKESNILKFYFNNEEYKVINGELYLEIDNDLDYSDIGVRCENAIFRINDFSHESLEEKNRFLLSQVANIGEPQKITVFRYSDNSIINTLSFIKFNNININFDKELYYGKNTIGNVIISSNELNVQKTFNIHDDEICIEYNNGEFVIIPPILRWKIDNDNWSCASKENEIWYKDITNTSILYLDVPQDVTCKACVDNFVLETNRNPLEYKLGQFIYAHSMTSEKSLNLFVKINNQFYPIAIIRVKEGFINEPIHVLNETHEIMWLPQNFIGDKKANFRLDIYKDSQFKTKVYCNNLEQKIDLSQLQDGYYQIKIYQIRNGFLRKENLLYETTFTLGNEKEFMYKGKFFIIKEVMLFNNIEPTYVKPIYIDEIVYLGIKDGFDYYSGNLYIYNKFGNKIYLNYMRNEREQSIKINPIRIEIKSNNSCYLGYGLDTEDKDFEYDNEFTLDYKGKTNIVQKYEGQRTKSIDYFLFEVKNV